MATNIIRRSPLNGMECTFEAYLAKRKENDAKHILGNGIPDYAYGWDYNIRKTLDTIPGFYKVAKKITATVTSQKLQLMNQQAVCATPTNFPDVYEIGCECAHRLGIALPNIYIMGSTEINAYTYACDDVEPFIVIYSALYERLKPGELKACIGHECGHIQNYHSTYNTLMELIASGGLAAVSGKLAAAITALLTQGVLLSMNAWSRAAEVTADRAGLICADSVEDCHSLDAKLMYGATFKEQTIDYDAIREQLEMQMNNPTKYAELWNDHPTEARRIMAISEFAQCRIYFEWRPDLQKPDSVMRSRKECDERCKAYIDLEKKGIAEGK
ncbi:MAG: M48 family metallopeptidase [Clostridiales bacterium]|nr:M48 family metallopeptidase [Clostridiales bacterium]